MLVHLDGAPGTSEPADDADRDAGRAASCGRIPGSTTSAATSGAPSTGDQVVDVNSERALGQLDSDADYDATVGVDRERA